MMKNPKTSAAGPKLKKAAAKSAKISSTKTAPNAPAVKTAPRAASVPTASAAVAQKAAEAIASTAVVATAEPQRTEAAKPAPVAIEAPKPTPKAKPEGGLPGGTVLPSSEKAVAPLATALEAGADQARAFFARTRTTGENLRQAVAESGTATTRGLIEINSKMLDLIRAQSDATIDLWRSTLTASSLSEAVEAQTSGLRRAYETSATQWKEIAETAGRVMGEATKPLKAALSHTP